jgi:hypothetical protein
MDHRYPPFAQILSLSGETMRLHCEILCHVFGRVFAGPKHPVLQVPQHIPPKWKPVRREEYAQRIDFARILIDRTIPSDRKAR